MDQFRTAIRIQPGTPVTHAMKLFTAGSCFADLLAGKLKESRFRAAINPFGASYNPLSIHKSLLMALKKSRPEPELYVQSEGSFRHLDFHSTFRAKTLNQLAALLQNRISEVSNDLEATDVLILTYGTSWAFRHKLSGQTASNCHKLPGKEFERFLLHPGEVVSSFGTLYLELKEKMPRMRIIVTVSPVRHLKDSLDMNQLSKAGLIVACHEISSKFKDVEYFPSYEIMIDDLRDYRFYDSDMIHPSAVAIDYIWEKFGERYFDRDTAAVATKCQELSRALSHRPFDASTNEHKAFLIRTLALAKDLQATVDVAEDIRVLESKLNGQAQLS